ncbi:MAG: tyrosine-type recombinase/integrase, partial [Chloroflexota bacterium]|nr:tyrosine-type recombinase/integrase [Chloroflexota bacterium]
VIEPLADADLRRLLAAAAERDRAVVLLLLDTGLRVSEVVGIRLGDLRPDGSIKVLGKGAAERIVPVGGAARRAIGTYLAQRGFGAAGERLFLNQGDQALTTSGVSQLLRRLRRRTGVSVRCNPHTFRHTFAHNYLVNGGDALSLQRILGHSSSGGEPWERGGTSTDPSDEHAHEGCGAALGERRSARIRGGPCGRAAPSAAGNRVNRISPRSPIPCARRFASPGLVSAP